MTDPRYARLFDVAYDAVGDAEGSHRRDIARRIANEAIAALNKPRASQALKKSEPRWVADLGVRGAARLDRAAQLLVAPKPPKLWNSAASPTITILASSLDDAEASSIFDALTASGATTWYYRRSLRVGHRWRKRVDDAIANGAYVVLVLSREGLQSEDIQYEIDSLHALEMEDRRERVLGVLLRDLKKVELEMPLRVVQYVRFESLGPAGIAREIFARWRQDKRETREAKSV